MGNFYLNLALKFLLCLDITMNPLFHTDLSISNSLKSVRKSVLIYKTIIDAAYPQSSRTPHKSYSPPNPSNSSRQKKLLPGLLHFLIRHCLPDITKKSIHIKKVRINLIDVESPNSPYPNFILDH